MQNADDDGAKISQFPAVGNVPFDFPSGNILPSIRAMNQVFTSIYDLAYC